jgi:hypothetical protein
MLEYTPVRMCKQSEVKNRLRRQRHVENQHIMCTDTHTYTLTHKDDSHVHTHRYVKMASWGATFSAFDFQEDEKVR